MGKDDEVTIGFWYSMGMQMGFGRGPIDELLAIKVADQTAWTGSVTTSTSFSINKENLFGGEKGEGGIVGTFTLQMGESSQAVLPALQSMLGGPVPAFRGVTTAFYDGKFCALNPYPKPWTFRVRRNLKGWHNGAVWYSSKAVIALAGGTIKAQNPAHIIYECLTNPSWGRGLTADTIDLVQLAKVADTLYAEGFGLCFRWIRQGSVSEFLQTILDHIGGIIDVDRRTGLITVTLIRADYTLASIPHFTYDNGLLQVEDLEVSALDQSTNSVAVSFVNPITNEQLTCAPVQNLAGVQISGAVNATTIEYFALPTAELASRVALRDLQANIGILKRVKLHMTHAAWNLMPGRVISISVPTLGIENMILRIGTLEPGSIENAEITLTALEDIFGLPNTSYVEPEPPGFVAPDRIARNVTSQIPIEASWADLCRFVDQANLNTITATQALLMVTGLKPQGLATHFRLWTALNSALSSAVQQAHGDWCPTGLTSAVIPRGVVPVAVALGSPLDLDQVRVGEIARINDEDFRVDAINLSTNTVTLSRGVADTVPSEHAAGSRVWFYQRAVARDLTRRVSGDRVYYRMQTKTSADLLDLASAAVYSQVLVARQGMPYPPRQVRANSAFYPALVNAPVTASWVSSNRLTQADRLISAVEGAYNPEANTTWNARLIRADNSAQLVAVTGIASGVNSQVLSTSYEGNVIMEVWTTRDGISSRQRVQVPFFLQQALAQQVYPLTYDEKDSTNTITLSRLSAAGPHITPQGFVGNGVSSRYLNSSIPPWVNPFTKFTMAAQVTTPVLRLNSVRDAIVGAGSSTNSTPTFMELAVITDPAGANVGAVAVRSNMNTLVTQVIGRPGWKYVFRSPVLQVGAVVPKPQAVLFLDASTVLFTVHLDDTESRAYRVRLSDMAVTGSFTFGGSTYRHIASAARRSNGDVWFSDYDSNKLIRVDLDASFTSGTVVVTATYDTSILSPYVGSIEFVVDGSTEYLLLAQYHTSESPAPCLYVIPATVLGTGVPFALVDRYKRFQLGRRIQGIAMRSGNLLVSRNAQYGSATESGFIEHYNILGMIGSLADDAIVNATTNPSYLVRVGFAPGKYCEDIAVHPSTNDVYAPTEGLTAPGSTPGFLAMWSSSLSVNGEQNRYVVEYDGVSSTNISINGQLFGNIAGTPGVTPSGLYIGGIPGAVAGPAAGFGFSTISNVLFQNQALTVSQYNNLFSGSYETGVLTAYEITLTNPGAEAGNTSGWTNETGGMVVRSANPLPYEGSYYFSGGPNAQTLARQRIDLVAAGVPAANLDSATMWAHVKWQQASYDGSSDPGSMGVRNLNAALGTLTTQYDTLVSMPGSAGLGGPWYWFPRSLGVTVPANTRHMDALYNASGRTGGTENDMYVDAVTLTLYKP